MPSHGSLTTAARHRRTLGASAAALLLGASLAACGSDGTTDASATPAPSASASATGPDASGSPSDDASDAASGTASASAGESPTQEPSESTATRSSGPSDSGPLRQALLGAAQVPGLNAESSWTQGRTGRVGSAAFGWCARFDALTVGARTGVQRSFGSGEDRAGQQVLDLVDATNARRAEQVFRGWHRDCRGRSSIEVGPIQAVPTAAGTAWWYLSNRPGGDGRWEAFGLAMQGSRITLLRMEHVGQDHSYPPGEDPLERAVATAAAELG